MCRVRASIVGISNMCTYKLRESEVEISFKIMFRVTNVRSKIVVVVVDVSKL